jgi:hypothetical protein
MDSAKAAVKDFMSKSGHHDTTVHEKVAPAVKHETIERQQHEEYISAIDKEVHQDHYHTTEQPILDKEVLPTTHHTNIIPVEHRSYEHGNNDEVEARLRQERAAYVDTVQKVEGATTREIAPVVAGEHKHHHVHETIQPVIQKGKLTSDSHNSDIILISSTETIEPHVTHTTVPIHEVHHNAAQHHAASALPAVSMAEFKAQGGSLTGREERQDGFIGEPKSAAHKTEHEHTLTH